jgi:hypothetical protein
MKRVKMITGRDKYADVKVMISANFKLQGGERFTREDAEVALDSLADRIMRGIAKNPWLEIPISRQRVR